MARKEYSYDADLPVYRAIDQLARERQISFQQAIHLILVEWQSLRTGAPLAAESLWGIAAALYAVHADEGAQPHATDCCSSSA